MFTREYILSLKSQKPIIERLKSYIKFDSNGCHIFTGGKDRCGYGRIKVGKHLLGAHKVMYLLVNGDYDQSQLELMHSCDNPACINPDHLSPGTHKQNIMDSMSKGRHVSRSRQAGMCKGNAQFLPVKMRNGELLIKYFSSRAQALACAQKIYSGSVCPKHFMSWRKTNNGACIYCEEEYRANKTKARQLSISAAGKTEVAH